jgi:signal transduction histidine kinase
MAWTTSGNLREFFGSREHSVASMIRVPARFARRSGRHLRRAGIIALAIAHLALLGELAIAPIIVEQKLASVSPLLGMSLPWLTITGLMLAIVWLARDWPVAAPTVSSAPTPPISVSRQPANFHQPAHTISSQVNFDPMTGLLARVSHDLRTPLNAVMGFSDLMQQEAFGPLGDARYQSYARHIHASSAELLKAAEDTLAMTSLVASPHTVANETADLHDLISDAFTMALIATPKPFGQSAAPLLPPIMLALKISPQLQIKCERRVLRQAMINLISAAISKVALTADGMRKIQVTAVTNGDVICLTITAALVPSASAVGNAGAGWNSAEDLPICLARALLELQGLNLTLNTTAHQWSAQVTLDGISQSDFFAHGV